MNHQNEGDSRDKFHIPKYSGNYVFLNSLIVLLLAIPAYVVFYEYVFLHSFAVQLVIFMGATLAGIVVGVLRTRFEFRSKAYLSKQHGPQVNTDNSDGEGWHRFDPEDPKYPEELDIAMQAWRAVYNSTKGGTVKEQLTAWVKMAYPQQSAASMERITTIANWDKTGGRPKQL